MVSMNKKWYESKVLWINFLSFIAIILQVVTGKEIFSAEYQALALTVINGILRMITVVPVVSPITKG